MDAFVTHNKLCFSYCSCFRVWLSWKASYSPPQGYLDTKVGYCPKIFRMLDKFFIVPRRYSDFSLFGRLAIVYIGLRKQIRRHSASDELCERLSSRNRKTEGFSSDDYSFKDLNYFAKAPWFLSSFKIMEMISKPSSELAAKTRTPNPVSSLYIFLFV